LFAALLVLLLLSHGYAQQEFCWDETPSANARATTALEATKALRVRNRDRRVVVDIVGIVICNVVVVVVNSSAFVVVVVPVQAKAAAAAAASSSVRNWKGIALLDHHSGGAEL
jgi:hypothetical protein